MDQCNDAHNQINDQNYHYKNSNTAKEFSLVDTGLLVHCLVSTSRTEFSFNCNCTIRKIDSALVIALSEKRMCHSV